MRLLYIAPEVLLSIIILVVGWAFTVGFYVWKERKRIKSRAMYFSKSLEEVLSDIISQSKSYSQVAKDISEINRFRYKLGTVTGLNFHFLDSNILEDLHSFVANKKIEYPHLVIKDITDATNGIEVQFQNFKYNYREFKEFQEDNYERWNQSINKILVEHDELFKEDSKDGSLSDLVKNIRSMIGKLQEIEDNDLNRIQNEFAVPLFEYCQNSGDIRCLSIKREVQHAMFNYENLVDNIKHFKELFEKDSTQAKYYHKVLVNKSNQIQKLL